MSSNGSAGPLRGRDGFVTPATEALDLLPLMMFRRRAIRMRRPGDWRPSPPTREELDLPLHRASARCSSNRILLVIIAGGQRSLLHNSSISEFCIMGHVECMVYTDTDDPFDAPSSMQVVPPRAYLRDTRLPPPKTRKAECCPPAMRNEMDTQPAQRMDNFFCDSHRAATLGSQYRFLPALGHARRAHASAWALGSLSWLAMVDDDAIINPTALRQVLGRVDPDVPSYLGDFGEWTYTIATSKVYRNASPGEEMVWEPPYACGGAGTVFSRAAVRKMDFLDCAARYHVGCFQSDWMIGECAKLGGVTPMAEGNLSWTSCGFCSAPCSKRYQARMLATFSDGPTGSGICAFAQQTPATLCSQKDSPEFVAAACRWSSHARSLAIRHSWCDCRDPRCAKGPHLQRRLYNAPDYS